MNYILRNLSEWGYYNMANEELADEYYLEIKKRFPQVVLIKEGIHQHFVVTEDRKRQLEQQLIYKRKNLLDELKGVNSALKQI